MMKEDIWKLLRYAAFFEQDYRFTNITHRTITRFSFYNQTVPYAFVIRGEQSHAGYNEVAHTLNQLRKFAHFLATIESSPHLERRKDREELDQEKGADIVPAEVVPDGAEVARTDRSNRNKLHVKIAGHFL